MKTDSRQNSFTASKTVHFFFFFFLQDCIQTTLKQKERKKAEAYINIIPDALGYFSYKKRSALKTSLIKQAHFSLF